MEATLFNFFSLKIADNDPFKEWISPHITNFLQEFIFFYFLQLFFESVQRKTALDEHLISDFVGEVIHFFFVVWLQIVL